MPAHLHAAPACDDVGFPCSPVGCSHPICRQGGKLLGCAAGPDGQCTCFHDYWLGEGAYEPEPQTTVDARAAQIRANNATLNLNWVDPLEARPHDFAESVARFRPRRPPFDPVKGAIATGPAVARAYGVIEAFVARGGPGAFPRIDRVALAAGALERIRFPKSVDQGGGWWCGPASFIHALVRQDPESYARYVTDLYDKGCAAVGAGELIKPSADFRNDPVAPAENPADWVALGALRDSSNWVFQYHRNAWNEHYRGGTSPGDVAQWFKRFGFREVISDDGSGGLESLRKADTYARRNYRVVLSVASTFIVGGPAEARAGGSPDHFIVLVEPIRFGPPIKMRVFNWAEYVTVPEVNMTPEQFLKSYSGFIAARR